MATSIGTTKDDTSLIDKLKQANATKTAKGTRIVKAGQSMDKDAFLRILSAELANQDPSNAKDGTEYVAQMAQFAGLEQMANLNSSIKLTSANSLIGRMVVLNKLDDQGKQYVGQVINVSKNGGDIKLGVLTGQKKDAEGKLYDVFHDFSLEDVASVEDMSYWLQDPKNGTKPSEPSQTEVQK